MGFACAPRLGPARGLHFHGGWVVPMSAGRFFEQSRFFFYFKTIAFYKGFSVVLRARAKRKHARGGHRRPSPPKGGHHSRHRPGSAKQRKNGAGQAGKKTKTMRLAATFPSLALWTKTSR